MEPTHFARIAILLQGKQQNTTLRQDITPGEISRKCVQGKALFIVVKVAQVVFLSCPGEALHQLLSICPGEAWLVSSRSALTILRTTADGCARKEGEMCIIVKTTSF